MGTKERKEREKQQRIAVILEAARRSFEGKGFLNSTLQDIAKEAEISVGLIYRYFRSKEDIFASLALKGAETFDEELEQYLKKGSGKKKIPAPLVLQQIALHFFAFYDQYGEYFDMLLYSYKGFKQVQIHSITLTRLMSVTLSSIDRIKNYIQFSGEFAAKDEDEALRIVFLLWGLLLGTHRLFDSSGRGHIFAFRQEDFIQQMLRQIFQGVAKPSSDSLPTNHPKRPSQVGNSHVKSARDLRT